MHHNKNHNDSSSGKVLAAFVAGAATALMAGGYYLYGPDGRRHREELDVWIEDTKDRILERLTELKDTTEETYNSVVDEVIDDYALARDLTSAQVRRLGAHFKARYRQMRRFAEEAAQDAEREIDELAVQEKL